MRNGFPDLVYEAKQDDLIEIPADGISLDLLRAVYRCSALPLSVRIRAAGLALPHEVPKLGITAHVSETDFAAMLDQRLKRMAETRLIEAKPTPPVEVKPALPRLADKRYRRI